MKWRNKEKYKNSSEIEKRDFLRMLIFIIASNNTSNKIIIIKTKTKTLFILMKSSYPTYHNNQIEEENKITLWSKNITHTHTYVHMDILLLTVDSASIAAPASISNLTVSEWPLRAAHMRAVKLFWWKY